MTISAYHLLENTPLFINSYTQTAYETLPKHTFSFDVDTASEKTFFQTYSKQLEEIPILFYENDKKGFLLCAEQKNHEPVHYVIKELDVIGNVHENDISYDFLDAYVCPTSHFHEAVELFLDLLQNT